MAKKVKEDISAAGSVFDLVKKFDDSVEIIADSAYSNIKDWISTGNYILNAAVSGSLFGGLPVGRVTMLAGEPQTGKSYLQCSVCREAQKKGYTPIILDTEGSIDAAFVSRIGVDPKNCIIKQCNTISETSEFIANLCQSLQAQVEKYGEHQKVILVLDSLGNLTSDKEKNDVLTGNQKRDMTKQQELKALFRVNMVPLAKLGVMFLCISHVYASVGAYVPTNIISGGCLLPNEKVYTLEYGLIPIKDIKAGISVLGYDYQFHEVLKTWKHNKETYTIEFENGKTLECSNTHRFLVDIDHPELNESWKTIEELNENDEIYIIDM